VLNRTLRRKLPSKATVLQQPGLRHLAHLFGDARLWSLNRRSVSRALAIGLFWTFVPIPLQTIPAALTCLVIRGHLPIAALIVWISNPLTWFPLYGAAYLFGAWVLGEPIPDLSTIDLAWMKEQFLTLWLGCMMLACLFSALGYLLGHALWQLRVLRQWEQRQAIQKDRTGTRTKPH
jgi:uncharacterized protein (DUF2062 family)